jgi:hypothetical protein
MRPTAAALALTAALAWSSPAAAGGYGKRPDGFTIGPSISLAIPTPSVGVEAKLANLVGASFDYGFVPEVSIQDVKLQLSSWRAGAKLYPFRGRFFLGVGYGSRTFTARKTVTAEGATESGELKVTSTYLAPELGWRFVWRSGFFMGLDFGWELVLRSSARLDLSAAFSASDRKDLDDLEKRIGKAGLPEIGLVRLGWFL